MKAVLQWVLRTMMKDQTGIVQTMPKKDIVDFNVAITMERLMRNGVDPNSLKNANQVENALNMIDNRPKVQEGIKSTSKAKVFDLEGKEIKNPKNIMGGKEVKETEAEIAKRIGEGNKQAAKNLRMKKIVDDAIDNMSPSLSGDTRTDAALVAEDMAESMGKVYDDLSQMERLDLYDQAYTALSKIRFKGFKKPKDSDPEDMAQGGRAGFSKGLGFFVNLFGKGGKMFRKRGDVPTSVFSEKTGPMTIKDLENIPEDQLRKIMRTQELGLYTETPEILKAGNLFERFTKKVGGKRVIDYDRAEIILNRKLRGDETLNELLQIEYQTRPGRAQGGRAGFKDGLLSMLDIKAEGRKSGKQQIQGAPEGITADEESVNAIIKADIPISQKINLLADLQYGKGRTRIEKDNQEIFLDEGGFKSRNIGAEFNRGGEGLGGKIMYNLESGDPTLSIRFKKSFADGGRIGLKEGSGMTRRTFLKLLGGLASIPIVGKILKPMKIGKTVTKVPMIKTDNVPGKPEWFDQLVNKVIIEGDDVTKKFATAERQSIHQKTLDDGSVVRVTEDVDDGSIRVEYESDTNVFEDPVQLQYKKPLPDEGDPRPTAEFEVAESGPVSRQVGPDDAELDIDEVGGQSISDLSSDVSKLKQYATGKGPTMKEILEIKKRKDRARQITEDPEAQMDAVIKRQGDYDPFASGGIARMLGE